MQCFRYCIAASAALLLAQGTWAGAAPALAATPRATSPATAAAAGQNPAPAQAATPGANPARADVVAVEGEVEYTLFLAGRRVGAEQVRTARTGSGWTISSKGLFGPPLNLTVNRFELKYTADWQPTELHIEATQPGRTLALTTSFGVTTATNVITQNGNTSSRTDQISARTVVLSNNFYAGYVALAARLGTVAPGMDLPAYIAPSAEIRIAVKSVADEQVGSPSGPIATKVYGLGLQNPSGPVDAEAAVDSRGQLVRLEIPAAGLRLVRSELAGIATRPQPIRNPTDNDVIIPAPGFNLAGTLTLPPGVGRLRHPAVILVAGSGQIERDEEVAGIPIFAELAGALADRGFIVLRYDKRGVGQSGGRSERATLQDYADDLSSALKWMADRQDVDPKRIAVAGHSEGGAVGMLAAAREKRIARLVLIAAPGKPGSELILEQQRHMLEVLNVPEAERQGKIELQQKIQTAVIEERGWEGIPPELRAQADSAWFRSLLLFDPSKIMPKIRQPILIVQGDLDTQVPPSHAEALASLARARKKPGSVDVLHLPGVNHLLVPAKTGEVAEYGRLSERHITPAAALGIADWLKK